MARKRRLSYQSISGSPSPNRTAPSPHGNAASSTHSHAPSPQGNAAISPTPQGPLILHLEDQSSQQGLTNVESQEQEEQVHNVRGPTRGARTEKLVKKKGKLVFGYTDTELRVHGEHAARFSNEIGSLVRHYAPIQYIGWSKIPKMDKEALLDNLERMFNFNLGADEHLANIIENTFSERYKDFRHRCYKKYQEFVENGVDPLEKSPFTYMKDIDWKWLCENCFVTETFQKKSAAGKANRAKSAPYLGGSKSLVQHLEEFQAESSSASTSVGKYIEVYRRTHWNEKSGWQSGAEERYNRMKELRDEKLSQLPEGSQLESDEEEEIYSQLLSNDKYEKYGFKRGVGPVKRRSITSSRESTQDLRTRLEDMELRFKRQEELLHQLIQQLNGPVDHPRNHNGPLPPPPPPPSASAVTC